MKSEWRTDDEQRVITIVHFSIRIRRIKNGWKCRILGPFKLIVCSVFFSFIITSQQRMEKGTGGGGGLSYPPFLSIPQLCCVLTTLFENRCNYAKTNCIFLFSLPEKMTRVVFRTFICLFYFLFVLFQEVQNSDVQVDYFSSINTLYFPIFYIFRVCAVFDRKLHCFVSVKANNHSFFFFLHIVINLKFYDLGKK